MSHKSERPMNIFYFDNDPECCAMQYIDKHVIKMILESAQILSTVYRLKRGQETTILQNGRRVKKFIIDDITLNSQLYQATHIHHPAVQWTLFSYQNFIFLKQLMIAINNEYQWRYNHTTPHKSMFILDYIQNLSLKDFEQDQMTTPISCMDQQYIISDSPIINYRNYYIHAKSQFATWKKRESPHWFLEKDPFLSIK